MNAFDRALQELPAPGAGCHTALLRVANIGVLAGYSRDKIAMSIRQHIPLGQRKVPDKEIYDAINKALADCKPAATFQPEPYRLPVPKPVSAFDGKEYRRKLIDRSAGCDEVDLWERSPNRINWEPQEDAKMLLSMLYIPSDVLYVGELYGKTVDTVANIMKEISSGSIPPHIIPNALTGNQATTGTGDLSYRCDAAVAEYRFAIAEFDDLSRPDQIAFWHSVVADKLLPVTALIDSGGKSFHAWLAVYLPDAAAWQAVVKDGLYHATTGRLTLLGADRACQNPARLSRLAGHFRKEKARWQRLLYLNVDAF